MNLSQHPTFPYSSQLTHYSISMPLYPAMWSLTHLYWSYVWRWTSKT